MAELDDFFPSFDNIFELLASPCSNQVRGEELGVADPGQDLGKDPTLLQNIREELSGTRRADSAEPTKRKRFASPKSAKEVIDARKASIPKKTQLDTDYCYRIWKEWRAYRNSIGQRQVPELETMENTEMNDWLCHFILEIRKKDGTEYPPNTIHHIVCGIMRHLRNTAKPGIDFFKNIEFCGLRTSLDSEMKRLQSKGLGTKRHQAEPLSEREEEILWETGQLGDHSPQALVDTMLFMCGVYFSLRSGQEHRALRHYPPQIELVEREGERAHLKYSEDTSKNNPGGLKGSFLLTETVKVQANPTWPFYLA